MYACYRLIVIKRNKSFSIDHESPQKIFIYSNVQSKHDVNLLLANIFSSDITNNLTNNINREKKNVKKCLENSSVFTAVRLRSGVVSENEKLSLKFLSVAFSLEKNVCEKRETVFLRHSTDSLILNFTAWSCVRSYVQVVNYLVDN